jgi:hypothetical protein
LESKARCGHRNRLDFRRTGYRGIVPSPASRHFIPADRLGHFVKRIPLGGETLEANSRAISENGNIVGESTFNVE